MYSTLPVKVVFIVFNDVLKFMSLFWCFACTNIFPSPDHLRLCGASCIKSYSKGGYDGVISTTRWPLNHEQLKQGACYLKCENHAFDFLTTMILKNQVLMPIKQKSLDL